METKTVDINKLYGWRTNDFVANIQDVRNGNTWILVKGKTYRAVKNLQGKSLAAGMLVFASYNSTNVGADLYEIQGFTDDTEKYGEGGIAFSSVKDLLTAKDVKTLTELEDLQSKKEYGFQSYMAVKDLNDGQEGPWFYLYEGRWSRGSGAEALSFVLVEEVTPEVLEKDRQAKAEEMRRQEEEYHQRLIKTEVRKEISDLLYNMDLGQLQSVLEFAKASK